MRIFLAIDIPEKIRKEIFSLGLSFLDKNENINAKPVEEKNLHLTLKFLGEVPDKEIDKIKETLKKIKAKSFNASLGTLGLFPSESFVRVVWISLEPAKVLNELHLDIDSILEKKGFKQEKNFKSHITIARVKRIKNKEELIKKLKSIKIKPSDFKISSFTLKKSILTSEGPVYENIAEFELS